MRIVSFIVLIFLAVILGTAIRYDPGYLWIQYGVWEIESPLWLALFIGVLIFLAWRMCIQVSRQLFGLADTWFTLTLDQKKKKAHRETLSALLAYEQEQWNLSEKKLMEASLCSDYPLLNYIYASYSALSQKDFNKAHQYLNKIPQDKKNHFLVELVRAEIFFKEKDFKESLACAQPLKSKNASSIRLTKLLYELYYHFGHWADLIDLKQAILHHRIMNEAEWIKTEIYSYEQVLNEFCQQEQISVADLRSYWQKLPKLIKGHDRICEAYAQALYAKQAYVILFQWIRQTESIQWMPKLLTYLIKIPDGHIDLSEILKYLEELYQTHNQDEQLLYVLGEQTFRMQLWGKSQSYWEACLQEEQGNLPARLKLSRLYMQLGQSEKAAEVAEQGLVYCIESTI